MSCISNKDHPDFGIFYFNDNNPITLHTTVSLVFPFDNLKASSSPEHKITDNNLP